MKLKLAIAFGIGYVLGARAGRERYEEMGRAAARVQADPRVRDAAATVETFVRDTAQHVVDDDRFAQAAASVKESAHKVAEAAPHVRERAAEAVGTVREKGREKLSGDDGTNDPADGPSSDTAAGDADVSDAPTVGRHSAHHVPDDAPKPPGSTWPAHPDEHIDAPEDEVVYSAGPESDEDPGTERATG